MATLEFRIDAKPVAQPRPRVFRHGGVRSDSKQSSCMKRLIREQVVAQGIWTQAKPLPVEVPIVLELTEYFPYSGAKRDWTYRRTKKPDVDNLAKLVMDALTGVIWTDDAQIFQLTIRKYHLAYGAKGGHVQVTIQTLDPWHNFEV